MGVRYEECKPEPTGEDCILSRWRQEYHIYINENVQIRLVSENASDFSLKDQKQQFMYGGFCTIFTTID